MQDDLTPRFSASLSQQDSLILPRISPRFWPARFPKTRQDSGQDLGKMSPRISASFRRRDSLIPPRTRRDLAKIPVEILAEILGKFFGRRDYIFSPRILSSFWPARSVRSRPKFCRGRTASSGFISRPGPSHAQPLLHSNKASPGPSNSWQFQLEASQMESLRAIFPHLSENEARSALTNYGSVDRAADALSANDPNEVAQESLSVIAVEDNPTSASDILTELRKQMQYPHKN